MAQRTTLLPSYMGISSFKEGPSGTIQYRWPQPSPKCRFRIPTTPAQVQCQHKQKILTTTVLAQEYVVSATSLDKTYKVSFWYIQFFCLLFLFTFYDLPGITYCTECTEVEFNTQRGKCCHNPVLCVPPANLTCHKYGTTVSTGFLYIFHSVGTYLFIYY